MSVTFIFWRYQTLNQTKRKKKSKIKKYSKVSPMVKISTFCFLRAGKELTGARVNTHGVAALYCVLDLVISRKPLRLMHAPYPMLFGAVYAAFSALYQLAGGRGRHGSPVIYTVLDWSSPWKTLIICSISNFLVIPLVHATLWGLGLVFEAIGERCGGGGGGRAVDVARSESPKTTEYVLHVDTETSSCGRNSSIAGNSRSSRIMEDC